ncbi:MAG: hypothetical protein M3295_03015, partial [Chloroflexota bacterium]|nr:hypothetical protein [Chloroflexota bacterium]
FADGLIRSLTVVEGSFLASGQTGWLSGGRAGTIEPAMWTSRDGEQWTRQDSPVAGGVTTAGPRGVVAAVRAPDVVDMYLKPPGVDWQLVQTVDDAGSALDLEAGDEGFVYFTAGRRADGEPEPLVLASSDGREWYAAEPGALPAEARDIAPLGGDWVAATGQTDPDATCPENEPVLSIWRGSSGLEWASVSEIGDPLRRDGFGLPSAFESAGGHLFLSVQRLVIENTAPHPMGVWHSTDAVTWELLRLGPDAEVNAVYDARGDGDDDAACCLLVGGRTGDRASPAMIWRFAP